jgi:hypothetical protein
MKVGKIPVAAIVLLVFCITRFVLAHFYPGQYNLESPFVEGCFFGAGLVYFLYYLNIWYTAWVNNKKSAKKITTI